MESHVIKLQMIYIKIYLHKNEALSFKYGFNLRINIQPAYLLFYGRLSYPLVITYFYYWQLKGLSALSKPPGSLKIKVSIFKVTIVNIGRVRVKFLFPQRAELQELT